MTGRIRRALLASFSPMEEKEIVMNACDLKKGEKQEKEAPQTHWTGLIALGLKM
jgi:hypothetical protein